MHEAAWQVFIVEEGDAQDSIDGRVPLTLRYVGRIVRPDDARTYWKPDEADVGERFGEGRFLAIDDEVVTDWSVASHSIDQPIYLDVVAETRYKAREDAVPA